MPQLPHSLIHKVNQNDELLLQTCLKYTRKYAYGSTQVDHHYIVMELGHITL